MSAKLTFYVKNESIMARTTGPLWFIDMFKKFPLDVYVDGEKTTVQANTEKTFDLMPGIHTIKVEDPRQAKKLKWLKINRFFMRLMFELPFKILGVNLDLSFVSNINVDENGYYNITLEENDDITIKCQANTKGDVKLRQM